MKAIAINLLLKALRLLGVRAAIRLIWKYFLYPKAKKKAESSDPEWDNKLVEFINDNLEKILRLF